MTVNPEDLRKKILGCFGDKKPDPEKLDFFIAEILADLGTLIQDEGDFLSEIETSIKISSAQKKYREDIADKKIYLDELQTKLQKFQKEYFKIKKRLTTDYSSFLQDGSIQYHLERGELIENEEGEPLYKWTRDLYDFDPEEGIIPFEEHVRRLEESLSVLAAATECEISSFKKGAGRPKSYNPYTIFIAKVCALSHCLLGLRIKKTNNEVDTFFKLILVMLRLVQPDEKGEKAGKGARISRIVSPCFDDPQAIISMAKHYKKYDCLDLYIEHVKQTPHAETIIDYFEHEWADWEKPKNYKELRSGT